MNPSLDGFLTISPVYLLLAGLAGVAGGIAAPAVAVGAILAVLPAYLLRTTVAGIPVTALEALLLGAVAGYALHWITARRRWQLRGFGRLNAPLAVLVLVWVASSALSHDLRAGLGATRAWLIEPMLLALLVVNVPRTENARWTMVGGLILGAVGLSFYGLWETRFHQLSLPPDGRLNSVFVPANYHAMFIAPVLALCLGLLRGAAGHRGRVVLLGLAALVLGASLLLTESYGGFLGVAFAGLVFIATLPRNVRGMAVTGFFLVALFAILPQLGSEKFHLLGKFNQRSSSSVRVQIWHTAVELTRQHPLLGVGPNAFETPYREEVAKLYWPPLEWLVAQPHNLYLALLSETGVLGFAAFAWLLASWFRMAVSSLRTLGQRPWVLAALLALIAMLAHGLVDTPVLKNDLAMLLAFILVLPYLGASEPGTRQT